MLPSRCSTPIVFSRSCFGLDDPWPIDAAIVADIPSLFDPFNPKQVFLRWPSKGFFEAKPAELGDLIGIAGVPQAGLLGG